MANQNTPRNDSETLGSSSSTSRPASSNVGSSISSREGNIGSSRESRSGESTKSKGSSSLSASSTSGSLDVSNIDDVLRDSINNVVNQVVANLEPQLNQFASKIADEAVDRGRALASSAYRRVQTQPWYLIGFAAVLLVGTAAFIGFGSSAASSEELH